MNDTGEDEADRACDWNAAADDTDIFGVCVSEEPVSREDLSAAAVIAAGLLPRGGWTGAQIELLEAVMAWNVDDPFILTEIEDMRDARDREEALRR